MNAGSAPRPDLFDQSFTSARGWLRATCRAVHGIFHLGFCHNGRYGWGMATDYDRLYGESANALGAPTQAFVDFFDRYGREDARVLDVGCGQGRDALFIARLGHRVLGVDLSANGIAGMTAAASAEGLQIDGVVADITGYRPDGVFDVVVIDRTLHMLAAPARLSVLARLLEHVAPGGWVLIADEARNMAGLRGVLAAHPAGWREEIARRGTLFVQRD